MVRLLKQLHPRTLVLSGCAILLVAGMTGLVAWLETIEGVRNRNTAIGLGALSALLIFLGGAAWIARGGLEEVAAPSLNTIRSEVLVFLLILFGGPLVVILADPATLHRTFGIEVFDLPIEYVLSMALALLFFLPLWLGYMGLLAFAQRAMRDDRMGKAGLIWEIGSLWLFIYPILFWIVYAAMFGAGPSAP